MSKRTPKQDGKRVASPSAGLLKQKKAVRERIDNKQTPLRIKGDLTKASAARRVAAEKKRKGIDPVRVRRVIGGGLPSLGKGPR